MYWAAALTPSTAPLKRPGANGLSTSAATAMCTSVGVTPTSMACGFSDPDCAAAGTTTAVASALTTTPTAMTFRILTRTPLIGTALKRGSSTSSVGRGVGRGVGPGAAATS